MKAGGNMTSSEKVSKGLAHYDDSPPLAQGSAITYACQGAERFWDFLWYWRGDKPVWREKK
jgi:hypothetical protein